MSPIAEGRDMPTVSEICSVLAKVIPMPVDEVSRFARALINSGDLPKAIGRNVPEMDMRDRAKLILAIAASDRPSGCAKAMRDRYDAKIYMGECDMTAGELLAAELQELSDRKVEAYQKWEYSDLEVSRGKQPRVKFRINENMRRFEGFQSEQPEFIGGAFWAKNVNDMARMAVEERSAPGLPVRAYVPGLVLQYLAAGSIEAFEENSLAVATALQAGESSDGK